mgnify:FL=1
MFHDIRDFSDTNYPERYKLKSFLTRKEFEFQINFIDTHYTIIRSDSVLHVDMDGDEDYAILTFDDGLLDHYYVANYLESKGLSGTFLVPTDPILEHKLIHTNKIQFIQASVNEKDLTKDILSNFENKELIWNEFSKTKWKDNWWSKEMIFITNILRRYQTTHFNNYEYTNYLFNKYVSEDEALFAKKLYLSTEQLSEMSDMNMIIGGHGSSSENLLLVDNVDNDVKTSSDFIKGYSDNFIFSYPNGGYNDDIKDIMKKYDCKLSFTINQMTITNLDIVDYLEFPRYDAPQKIKLK